MFRNFVSPPALDRDGVRPSIPPDSMQTYSHPGQPAQYSNQPHNTNGPSHSHHHGVPNGYDRFSREEHHAYSQHTGATIVQSSDVTRRGGGYTTSIFVNGGGGANGNQAPIPGAPQYQPSQNAQIASRKHPPAASNGQNSATVCPQSPHPGTHSTHAYTPINSANIGLAALSITEDDDEQQQQHQQPRNDFSSQLQYAALNLNHYSHQYGMNNTDNTFFPTGNGSSHRRIDEHRGDNGCAHHPSSLYPIVDEQEEEDADGDEMTSFTALCENQSNQTNFMPACGQPIPGDVYSQRTFNVIPATPPCLEHIFAGRRDVRDPKSVSEKQIVSAKGTVRGFKNRVKAGIATFWAQPQDKRNFRSLEQGKIVIYATSMCVVRETSERCKAVRSLLQNHMVRYEERDLYMSREIQQELKHRLCQEGLENIRLPHVFADGICIGGAEELERLNEAGELRGLLNNYQKIVVRIMCEGCGGYRFTPCEVCHGSKRSLLRNHFTEEFCALRCMHCNESGLRRCELCKDQQE